MTLSTISLDSRTDLPKVRYATALDWFLLMSFGYCIATLLEFAGVHYFTKVIVIFNFNNINLFMIKKPDYMRQKILKILLIIFKIFKHQLKNYIFQL